MKPKSKKEIKEAIEKLKGGGPDTTSSTPAPENVVGRPQAKKTNKQRIRKKGV